MGGTLTVPPRSRLVRLRDGAHEGLGEISPLPGYSDEPAAAAFGAFMARLDLEGRRTGRPAHALLGARRDRLPLSALVEDLAGAADAVARGVAALKVKRRHFELLPELRRRWPEIELRLDTNGAPVDAAALAPFAPTYVEEGPAPFSALDESLQRLTDAEVEARLRAHAVRALVLKPMALGPERCLALARLAAAHDVPVTVTHTLDGPLGLAAAAALALALPGRVLAVGLDRHAGLDAWPPARIAALTPSAIVAWDAPGLGVEWIS
jgi:L-alanine-DL-glutamate epimerase-like enolase superfamily enzyme